MDTEEVQRRVVKDVFARRQLADENERLKWHVATLKAAAQRTLDDIRDYERRACTGWWAFFAQKEDGSWVCNAVINPDDERWETEELPCGSLIMPIMDPESMPEFSGF